MWATWVAPSPSTSSETGRRTSNDSSVSPSSGVVFTMSSSMGQPYPALVGASPGATVPPMGDVLGDLRSLAATALAELVRRGEVKPIELVDAAIARIEALDPRLNAVI